jgi:Flp pilus assembly protein TadG
MNAIVTPLVARFAHDQRGLSAVEFAMLLPLMVTLYLGGVEVSQGVAVDRKVTVMARTVADLTAQVAKVNNADMTNILNASEAVMQPYSTQGLKITVSSVVIDANGIAKIAWSDTKGGAARSVGSIVSIPPALAVPNTSLIWGETSFAYKPVVGYVITGTINLSDQMFMRPRLSDKVERTAT